MKYRKIQEYHGPATMRECAVAPASTRMKTQKSASSSASAIARVEAHMGALACTGVSATAAFTLVANALHASCANLSYLV